VCNQWGLGYAAADGRLWPLVQVLLLLLLMLVLTCFFLARYSRK
jgi:hypothetical protein